MSKAQTHRIIGGKRWTLWGEYENKTKLKEGKERAFRNSLVSYSRVIKGTGKYPYRLYIRRYS